MTPSERRKLDEKRQRADAARRAFRDVGKPVGIMETPGFSEKQRMILDQYRDEVLRKSLDRLIDNASK